MSDIKFLRQVADYFCSDATIDSLAQLIMVVPNRRSGIFLKTHFRDALAGSKVPVMMPRFHTMGRLVQNLAQCPAMSRSEQVFLLYEAYCEVLDEMGNSEQARDFDRFAFWGEIILNDFNDIDSSLSDASKVFRNLKNLKEISADFLTDEQKDIVRRLWGESQYTRQGSDSFWLHLGNEENSEAKKSFIQLWELLAPLYRRFHEKLTERGLTTEGRQQRMAVEAAAKSELNHKYVFVGFSTLTNAEFAIMEKLRSRGIATFFWDFGMLPEGTPLKTVLNKFGRLENALPAPADFKLSPATWSDHIECIAVPSNTAQSKYLSKALQEWFPATDENSAADEALLDTAIIVPDEGLLPTMVLSLPSSVDAVNITLRLPYRSTTFASLLSGIISMQLRARKIHDEFHFFYEDVERVLSHPHLHAISGANADKVLRRIHKEKIYNISAAEIRQLLPELEYIFQAVKDFDNIDEIHNYTAKMLDGLEKAFNGISHNAGLIEYRMLSYFREKLEELIGLVRKYRVTMRENTYFTLFERLLSSKKLDLHGSPLKGLQIMGVLETRALDFDRVIITSMNERVFPKRNYLRTMIPDSLRHAYGLNTEEEADAAYTYYFYRSVTGARSVKLLYDNRSASLGAGEVSRFISQLKHLQASRNIRFNSLVLGSENDTNYSITVEKDAHVMSFLDRFKDGGDKYLSASSLKHYLTCPLKFYLMNVRGLNSEDDVNPYLSAADYGTVIHSVMQELYSPYVGKQITQKIIRDILKSEDHIFNVVSRKMSDYINKERTKNGQKPRELNNEIKILCRVIVHFVLNVLKAEHDQFCCPSFKYIAAEYEVKSPAWQITPDLAINFKMFVDRIDEIEPGLLRFIDYKTGGDKTQFKSFKDMMKDHNAIFQLLLYCEAYRAMVNPDVDIRPVVYNFTIITASGKIDNAKIGSDEILNYKKLTEQFMPEIVKTIEEIFDPETPFSQCEVSAFHSVCEYCEFKDLCGR